jgi:hypothetical protein
LACFAAARFAFFLAAFALAAAAAAALRPKGSVFASTAAAADPAGADVYDAKEEAEPTEGMERDDDLWQQVSGEENTA